MTSRRERLTTGDYARWWLATLVGVLLAVLVIKTTVMESFLQRAPGISFAIAPESADARTRLALRQFQARASRLTDEEQGFLLATMDHQPLAAEPFMAAGVAAQAQGDNARARALLEEAVRRNPRLRPARLHLINVYILSGRVAQATREISVMTRLLPEASPLLVSQLGMLAENELTRETAARSVNSPALIDAVLYHLVQRGSDAGAILDFAHRTGHVRTTTGSRAWQETLLVRLVSDGDVDLAYRAWRQFTPNAPQSTGTIYDAGFARLPGIAPFNWRLIENQTGNAAIPRPGALEVEYFGRENSELAAQLLRLAPGSYQLAMAVERDAPAEAAHLQWQVDCVGSGTVLATLPLTGPGPAQRRIGGRFTVPAGCRTQWLRLLGVSTEFPAAQLIRVRDLRITSASGGA